MKTTFLFIVLLFGATAPLQAHWYQKLKAFQEAMQQRPALSCPSFADRPPSQAI